MPGIRVAVATALAVLATACSSTPATQRAPSTAAPAAPSRSGTGQGPSAGSRRYLALGDSVPFGYTPTGDTARADSFVGYPDLVAEALHLTLTNASCPGETSASFIATPSGFNTCRAWRALAPLHVRYAGSQLEFATQFLLAHPATTLVTIMLGANDLLQCARRSAADCVSAGRLSTVLADYAVNLRTILAALRRTWKGELVAVTYYATDYRNAQEVAAVEALDARTAQVVRTFGGEVVDGFAAFRVAAAGARGDVCAAHLLARTAAGGCDIHPSATGARVLAAAVERAVSTAGRVPTG